MSELTRRGTVIGILVLLLGGLAIFASIQLLATEKVLYLEPEDPGPDPFTPPAVFTSDSPGPPAPIDPSVPISTPTEEASPGDNPGPVGGTVKKGDCDSELLIQYLNANPERRALWLDKLEVLVDDFEDYLRAATPAILSRDTRVTTFGRADGAATDIQAILATGTSVLVDEEGDIAVRCFSGSPLTPPRQIKYNCTSCPSDLPPPPPCNRTCYNVPSATPAVSSTTTSSRPASSTTTTTTRPLTSTTARSAAVKTSTTRRRATTTTRTTPPAPVTATFFSTQPTTFPPAATAPPTTQPPATTPTMLQTAATIPPQTFPPAATNPPTTQPQTTTTDCELIILCL